MKSLLAYAKSRGIDVICPNAPLAHLPRYAFEYKAPWAMAELLNILDMTPSRISRPQTRDVHYLRAVEKHFNIRLLPLKQNNSIWETLREIEDEVTPHLFKNEEGLWESNIFAEYDDYEHYEELSKEEAVECTHCGNTEELDDLTDIEQLHESNIWKCGQCDSWFRAKPTTLGQIKGAVEDRIEFYDEINFDYFRHQVDDWVDYLEEKGFTSLRINNHGRETDIDLVAQDFLYEVTKYGDHYHKITLYKDGTATANSLTIEAGYSCDLSGEYISPDDSKAVERAKVLNLLEESEWYDRIEEHTFEGECMDLLGELSTVIGEMGWSRFGLKAATAAKEYLDNL